MSTSEWIPVRRKLTDFGPPKGDRHAIPLDIKQIYRVGIMVSGQPSPDIHGHIDIRDLRFEH
jgi:hypothetical protein